MKCPMCKLRFTGSAARLPNESCVSHRLPPPMTVKRKGKRKSCCTLTYRIFSTAGYNGRLQWPVTAAGYNGQLQSGYNEHALPYINRNFSPPHPAYLQSNRKSRSFFTYGRNWGQRSKCKRETMLYLMSSTTFVSIMYFIFVYHFGKKKFAQGKKMFSEFWKKMCRGEKGLKSHETCSSAKKYFSTICEKTVKFSVRTLLVYSNRKYGTVWFSNKLKLWVCIVLWLSVQSFGILIYICIIICMYMVYRAHIMVCIRYPYYAYAYCCSLFSIKRITIKLLIILYLGTYSYTSYKNNKYFSIGWKRLLQNTRSKWSSMFYAFYS
jgi:hypothetical protein